jgi:peptide deformylase
MAIRKVARMGHPVLRLKARKIETSELRTPGFRAVLRDMFETLEEYEGIGIAAPQIRESMAVAIIAYPLDGEPKVVINPEITVLDSTLQGYWEGCLSIPELRGLVYRPRKVRIEYMDLDGNQQVIEPEGFEATVYQHELDHLFGVLFVDRVKFAPGESPIAFTEEYARYHAPGEDDEVGELDD